MPPGTFSNTLVKIVFIFDKSLMPKLTFGEIAIFTLVTVCQKNGKYSDHLGEPPYKNKCSVPPGRFSNTLVKILFIVGKSLMPKLTFCERVIFTSNILCLLYLFEKIYRIDSDSWTLSSKCRMQKPKGTSPIRT